MNIKQYLLFWAIYIFCSFQLIAQPEFMPWGNLKGIRIEGEMMNFETSLRSVYPDWSGYVSTEKYNWEGKQSYIRNGKKTTVSHFLLGKPLNFSIDFTELAENSAKIAYNLDITDNLDQAGTYFCIELPANEFINAEVNLFSVGKSVSAVRLDKKIPDNKKIYIKSTANKVIVKSKNREYTITTPENTEIFIRQDFIHNPHYRNDPWPTYNFVDSDPKMEMADYQIYFTISNGKTKKGSKISKSYQIDVKGTVDKEDVLINIDATKPAKAFKGISGNFRNQFPNDSIVMAYCLDSLRVTYGRISMWWSDWQPFENQSPLERLQKNEMPKHVIEQMEIARKLAKRNIPVMVSVWSAPNWAIDATAKLPKGVKLNMQKMDKISQSIADYLLYLKSNYGVEAEYFSFNETDCGVEVFQTAQEHAIHNKLIGSYLSSQGLNTKMLLGDTGHGTAKANQIVAPSVFDSSIHKYLGAVAFHTYHGCNDDDLKAWALTAKQLNLPLMVTELGSSSAAHRYPLVFLEPWLQLDEINTAIRICNLCQVNTIMAWQLTADYSVLTGAGLYGDNGALRPTQRFWNLKQLGATPENSFYIPISCNKSNVTVAALADIKNGVYTIHLVNNGAARKLVINGLPKNITALNMYITDSYNGMAGQKAVQVINGKATFVLKNNCFTTVSNSNLYN